MISTELFPEFNSKVVEILCTCPLRFPYVSICNKSLLPKFCVNTVVPVDMFGFWAVFLYVSSFSII